LAISVWHPNGSDFRLAIHPIRLAPIRLDATLDPVGPGLDPPFRSAATRIVRPAMAGRLRLESRWTRVMANPSKLLTEALDLPVRDRLRLAGALLRSVDPAEDDDAAEAWAAELDRRADSIDDATLIDAPDAHAQVRAALQAQRANAR
jgi:putative addiction module component (TIGR02574 family)